MSARKSYALQSVLRGKTLYAIVCENGNVYRDRRGEAVFTSLEVARNILTLIQLQKIGECDCKDHEIVEYAPRANKEEKP